MVLRAVAGDRLASVMGTKTYIIHGSEWKNADANLYNCRTTIITAQQDSRTSHAATQDVRMTFR